MMGLEFGVDWYPEQWDEERWEDDARRMAAFGVTAARVMEFAWALVEPEPGRYDFSLFDRAIAALGRHGIRTIVGTPTATFPPRLVEEFPGMLQVHPSGLERDYGTRRAGCFNHPGYRAASTRLAAAIGDHFGKDARVAGFQVDNELGHEGSDRCACGNCRAAWHRWLEAKYVDPGAMNAAWGTVFWGAKYERFDQAPVPRDQVSSRHNPGLMLDYDRFCSDSAIAFADAQVRALRERIARDQWITTNLYPPPLSNAIDFRLLVAGMDFASWDNYPIWGPQAAPLPWQATAGLLAHVRGLKDGAPFTVMEQFAGMQGHVALGRLPDDRQAALWTAQAIARGADRIVWFRWRTAPFGQEQLCHGLHDADDRETSRGAALRQTAARARAELGSLASARVPAEACVAYRKDDARVLREQYLSEGLVLRETPWMQAGFDMEFARAFAPFATFGVGVDALAAESLDAETLARYRVVSLPLHQMADPALVERLGAWVDSGGTLVLGFRSGARTTGNFSVDLPLPGLFRPLAGVTVRRFESLGTGSVRIRVGILPARGTVWADIVEPETAEPAAYWTDRSLHYRGAPCATVNKLGRGKVWYLGTSPDPLGMVFLYRRIFKESGVDARFLGADLERVPRLDADGRRVDLLLNHSPKPRRVLGRVLGPWDWVAAPKRGRAGGKKAR
jgi:beta-galactosidase